MAPINIVLNDILTGQSNSCSLCFKTVENPTYTDGTAYLREFDETVDVSHLLQSVLGEMVAEDIIAFGILCEHCTKTLIDSYVFAKQCQRNVSYLSRALESLITSIDNTTKKFGKSKTLYVTIDPDNGTSNQFYDKYEAKNISDALKRISDITTVKEEKKPKTKRGRRSSNPIPLEDILLDGNIDNPKCKVCLKGMSNVRTLKYHYIRMHAPKTFKCSQCHKGYGSLGYLLLHRLESHCTSVCRVCGKTFHNRHTFKLHESSHTSQIVCQDCGRVYKSRDSYKKHIELGICGEKTRRSPSNGTFTCDYCNKKYTQKTSLRVHIQFEHGNLKAYECEWCHKKFWAKSRLNAHIVKHTKERNFTCDICNGKFVTKESLLYHRRIHTGEKPYACDKCGATFVSASRRLQHVKRYHGESELECDICFKKFKNEPYFLKHKRAHYETKNEDKNDENNLVIREEVFLDDYIEELTDEDVKNIDYKLLKDKVDMVHEIDGENYILLNV